MDPNTLREQQDLNPFVPDANLFFGVGISKYDKVFWIKEMKNTHAMYVTQAFGNVDQAPKDVENMKNYLSKYNFEFQEREKSKPAAPGKKKANTYVKFNEKKDMD